MIDILLMRHVTLQRMGVEVAVRAFLHAPRDVDVETQRGSLSIAHGFQHQLQRLAAVRNRPLLVAAQLGGGAAQLRHVEDRIVTEAAFAGGLLGDPPAQLPWNTSGVGSSAWRR